MASTTFIDNQTTIYAAWLNDVNNAVYNGNFVSTTLTAPTMICTGTASGVGFTNLINNTFSSPAAIGNTTPNTGAFTTLSATSASFSSALPIASGGTGLTSVGTSGYALSSNGSGLVYKQLGLGMTGEIWHDASATRSFNGGTYTNSRSYPIMVSVGVNGNSIYGSATVSGVSVGTYTNQGNGSAWTSSFIVSPGGTYSVSGGGSPANQSFWSELY